MIAMMITSGLQEALFPPSTHVLCLLVDKKSKNLSLQIMFVKWVYCLSAV